MLNLVKLATIDIILIIAIVIIFIIVLIYLIKNRGKSCSCCNSSCPHCNKKTKKK